jgi:hypothetical protein
MLHSAYTCEWCADAQAAMQQSAAAALARQAALREAAADAAVNERCGGRVAMSM